MKLRQYNYGNIVHTVFLFVIIWFIERFTKILSKL